jgi:hypothetical protein
MQRYRFEPLSRYHAGGEGPPKNAHTMIHHGTGGLDIVSRLRIGGTVPPVGMRADRGNLQEDD